MTRRKEIIEILKKHKISVQELTNIYKTEISEIMEDVDHIKTSFKQKFKTKPPQCNFCGFVYKERSKIKKPSRCPKCKHEDIIPLLFWIEE
ncbi:hypothetical protein COV16_05290 [Candidatus Woesearchaeota archaeon CG10_big_fil_rev_8_21_14_0_10_34_8]|nr:MAG: hypothetical protein COV16_05290 [Candidatus Woesearchaeota archaeon CG10_big_fil_rev_8_21_14_0_10_34_8]